MARCALPGLLAAARAPRRAVAAAAHGAADARNRQRPAPVTAQHLRSAAALALSEAASGRADGRERAGGCGDGCYDARADAYRLTTHCACAARRGDLRARVALQCGVAGHASAVCTSAGLRRSWPGAALLGV